MKPYYQNELTTIYNSPMLQVLKTFKTNQFYLLFTDPPYGINMSKGVDGFGLAKRRQYDDDWDSSPPTQEEFDEMLRVAENVIIFGGNFFTDKLQLMDIG